MRAAHVSRFVPVSLMMLMWLTLGAGLAQAADLNQAAPGSDDQSFLTRARSDNAQQIAMAKLALTKSSNPRVIELAHAIIQERTALDARLAQLMPTGSRADTAFDANGNPTMDRLQALDGDRFDRSFASTTVRNHCRSIAAYQAIKLNASNPALKDLSQQAVPALRGSLTEAMSVLRSARPTRTYRPQEAVAHSDARGSKAPVFWEPISLVAAPW